MITTRTDAHRTAIHMLDDAAQAARSGFACLFSSSDEYEAALIAERRAQGRYSGVRTSAPNYTLVAMFVGCSLVVAGVVLLMV